MNDSLIELAFQRLNLEQEQAVEHLASGWQGQNGSFRLSVVEGPPGTGKTTVAVMGAIRYLQASRGRGQVAFLTFTHTAADRALRAFQDLGATTNEVRRVVDGGRQPRSEFEVAFDRLTDLSPNEQRQLRQTQILISTLHAARRVFEITPHPLKVVDEVSQVRPSLFFRTVAQARRKRRDPSGYALVGDPHQLPVITTQPTLATNIATYILARRGLAPRQLVTQYRMHEGICAAVNALRRALNTYALVSDASVVTRTLVDLPAPMRYTWQPTRCPVEFHHILDPRYTCVLINTDSLMGSEEESLNRSKYFLSEARLAIRLADALSQAYPGINGDPSLAPVLLSPYDAQVGVLQGLSSRRHRSLSVYRAQGQEYPCVIVSFARKNPGKYIGFLGEPEMRAQTYVACSRPMAKLILLLSVSTFRGHRDFDYLMQGVVDAGDAGLIVDADPLWGEI